MNVNLRAKQVCVQGTLLDERGIPDTRKNDNTFAGKDLCGNWLPLYTCISQSLDAQNLTTLHEPVLQTKILGQQYGRQYDETNRNE